MGRRLTGGPELVRCKAKYRPMRDGMGPSSLGRYRPENRWPSRATPAGEAWRHATRHSHLGQHLQRVLPRIQGSEDLPPLEECPFPADAIQWATNWLMQSVPGNAEIQPGQPFRLLHHLSQLAELAAGDLDAGFPKQLHQQQGAPLGVLETLQAPAGVLAPSDLSESEDELTSADLRAGDNYPLTADHDRALWDQYTQDETEGLGQICEDDQEAAALCGCLPSDLIHGALFVKEEGDGKGGIKLRPIHDASHPRGYRHHLASH